MCYGSVLLVMAGACLFLSAPVKADQTFLQPSELQFNDRQLYLNTTTSYILLIGVSLVLLVGLGALALYFYDIFATTRRSDSGDYYYYAAGPYDQSHQFHEYAGYHKRSANDGYGMGDMNILKWLAMAQEVYNKFDLTSMDCQKKVVCEIVQQQEVFGSASRSLESSFQFASLLENFNLPDDVRDILDEYMDASEQANGQKNCEEVFDCPFSIADAVKRSFYGNSL